mgnify:CR=1 FL=1
MNFLSTVIKGGPLMIPITLCSIIMLAVALERWYRLRKQRILPDSLVQRVLEMLRRRRLTAAIEVCNAHDEVGASVIRAGLSKAGAGRDVIREGFENAGRIAYQELTRGLGVLATVASISPLLGLMGTVTGLIRAFRVISSQGIGDPQALSGGISEALITTVAGLIVAIPTLVVHNYFARRVERINLEMEQTVSDILDQLTLGGPLDSGSDDL